MKFIFYLAQSLDGYIADRNGNVEWLENIDTSDKGFDEFLNSVDAILMGRNTYDQILSFGEWPYSIPTYVITHNKITEPPNNNINSFADTTDNIISMLSRKNYDKVWVCGGNQLISKFENKNLFDVYIITIIPIFLGGGLSALNLNKFSNTKRLESVRTFKDNTVILKYRNDK
ncbi:MAG TPA: dihydrofolate reductase family protein [Victivallales bacterium]|nr:dihydrofolate reductase family protein [Victivallales bacterium]